MKNILSIDPGKEGFICFFEDGKFKNKYPIPLIKNEVDVTKLGKLFSCFKGKEIHVAMELVHAIFGSSAKATFSFGKINGFLEGLIVANGFPYSLIQPKIWQKEMFQGIPEIRKPSTKDKNGKEKKGRLDTKAMSILTAKRLFPDVSLLPTERCRKEHDGISDALLIGEYIRRKLG